MNRVSFASPTALVATLASCVCLLLPLAPSARAQEDVAYSNLNLNAFENRGGNLQGAQNLSGNTITALYADDITVAPGFAGKTIGEISTNIINFLPAESTPFTFRANLRIWGADGVDGAPGSLLLAMSTAPMSVVGQTVTTQTFTLLPSQQFTVPAIGMFWAGISFDDNFGTTGATATQLNSLGLGLFSTPDVGSSVDHIFSTGVAGSFDTDNPAGNFAHYFPPTVANFGLAFRSVSPVTVPESSTATLCVTAAGLLLMMPIAGSVRRRSNTDRR